MDHKCRTYFGLQVISASDDTDVSKADSNFSKTTLACQVLSNWKSLMTWPNHCNWAFAAPLAMLSSGRLNKTTSLENMLDLTCFPFPVWTGFIYLPHRLASSQPLATVSSVSVQGRKATERGGREVDLFSLNRFESHYKFTREKWLTCSVSS